MLQEDMQEFNLTEAQKVAAVAKLNRAFDEKLATRGAEQTDTSLTLKERAQILDETYKLGNLAIDQAASKAVSLGSKAKTAQLNYLTDTERLAAYANGTLGDQTAAFEQALIDYQTPKTEWDGKTGAYTKTAKPQLGPRIKAALEAREAGNFGRVILKDYEYSTADPTLAPSTPLSSTADALSGMGIEIVPEDEAQASALAAQDAAMQSGFKFDTPEFRRDMYSPEKGVDFDSVSFNQLPTKIIKPHIRYYDSTGMGSLGARFVNYFHEAGREIFNLAPLTEDSAQLIQSDRDINQLREVIVQEMKSWTEGRVLGPDVAAMRESIADLTPGLFKTDEGAMSTLASVKGRMARAYGDYASADPELHPENSGKYTAAQITSARVRMDNISSLMAEVHAIEQAYGGYLDNLRVIDKKPRVDAAGNIDVTPTRTKLQQLKAANQTKQ